MLGFNYKKAVQALNFFAIKGGGEINKMKALKLIWLSDRLHIRKFGRPILNDTYFALNYGPVASNTKDLAENTDFLTSEEKEYRNHYIENTSHYNYISKSSLDQFVFSSSDLEVMQAIYEKFAHLSEFKLSEISHLYPEWKKFESYLNSKTSSRFEMNYEDFFENTDNDYNNFFNDTEESLNLSKEVFLENGLMDSPLIEAFIKQLI